ncbi:uncharacterized protein [Eucyclogobius newberryi]|uniref:uncharacterized protein n=1 Tax=Eucyclogobius newberryi TaxID=166745 RepID=UPI003B5B1E58
MGGSKTSFAVFSALSSKPELTVDTPGDRGASIKTATSTSTKTRSPTSHKDESRIESPLSPSLSPSTPLPRPPKPSRSPFSFRPNDSPSVGCSLTSEDRNSYPKISPALRTTFTLAPCSSLDAELLPKISLHKPPGSDVKSSKPFQNSSLDLDADQSDEEKTISPSPSKVCSRSGCAESPRRSLALSTARSRLSGDTAVCRTSQHEPTGRGSMSKQHKQHFLSDLSQNVNSSSVLTGKHQAMSTGCAKESTFALIREYHNALKSIQDSDDEMSSDSLDLALCEDDSADEDSGAQSRTHNCRSTDDWASSARASSARLPGPGISCKRDSESQRDLMVK